MKKITIYSVSFLLLFLISSLFFSFKFFYKADPAGYQIINEVFARAKLINSISYTMKKQEKIDGKLVTGQSSTKLVYKPFKVYVKQELPKAGLEVLYVAGKNNNHAIINTNGFPWVNLNLNPMGSTMRDNNHHTIFDSDYSFVISILERLAGKYTKELESMITNSGTVIWNGRACWLIHLKNQHFRYENYTVKAGETILTIADRSKLSEYMILQLNKNEVDSYTDVKEGQVIIVPNDYSPRMELYIDKQEMVPLVMKIYDDKSLFEQYEYTNLVINPVFKSNEFDKDFSDYNF